MLPIQQKSKKPLRSLAILLKDSPASSGNHGVLGVFVNSAGEGKTVFYVTCSAVPVGTLEILFLFKRIKIQTVKKMKKARNFFFFFSKKPIR